MTNPCLYSIVRYAPFAETEEFVNIGVVMCMPKLRKFHFRLTKSNDKRVRHFFRDDSIFPYARDAVHKELMFAQEMVRDIHDPYKIADFFNTFIVPRESIFFFSPPRVILSENPDQELTDIYNRFINHSEYSKERKENILTRELKDRLNRYDDLKNLFKKEKVDGELSKFTLPFVAKQKEKIVCVIKPLAFAQQEASGMIEHCDSWVARITRAASENILSIRKVLFTVYVKENLTQSESKAFDEIQRTLTGRNIYHVQHDDEKSIIDFARLSLFHYQTW
ncbi:DUF3037 domain-containing protein [Xenorhabdus doucetiae]|uniref:DUF3037 domain-containing protein n=1 Tax=Xenorhabdus doucetiae TaxID=351671 RepID=A0A068QN54_9GAMM|nr:DUF3037 domain-containing protein [Xenorhabdus doucetiae]TYP15904.1 Protein of unknown function (DUF3037) [Xenorhabdus doucetiae]CDG16139.1 conserved protein of unknown function [Xenorhabdus doucetiae]